MLKNSSSNYGHISKFFHWLLGVSYIVILAIGFIMGNIENKEIKYNIYSIHKAFGVLLLIFICLRVVWRVTNIHPDPINKENIVINLVARSVHFLLYSFMLAMPLSGVLMSLYGGRGINIFGLFKISAFETINKDFSSLAHLVHVTLPLIFVILICAHILAAFYHHFYKKDQTLNRMLP